MLIELQEARDRIDAWEVRPDQIPIDNLTTQLMYDLGVAVKAARQLANGKEVWLCGSGLTPMRPGKPSDLSCIFANGHFEACGRYVQIALGTGDINEN